MEQPARNEESRVERKDQIPEERNQSCTCKKLSVKGKCSAETDISSPGFPMSQSKDSGLTKNGMYDNGGVGDARI